MHSIKYIRYFLYLAYNWNMRIARHIIKHEITGERKYGIDSTGADELAALERKGVDISHATIYMPASYDLLEAVFNRLKDEKLSHFIDIGCGKGRAMSVAAHYGFNKVSGIDFSKELCQAAVENLEKVKLQLPLLIFQVVNNDAFYYDIPKDVDCIFLFNPFDELIMSGVVKNIEHQRKQAEKDVFIIYLNPLHKELFIKKGYQEIFHSKKLNYLEASILQKKR
ncbi:MAG: class I SAM-dependent methyltransferase [Ferruginibacter sp.]|nr:class I SAM-dependent methyltransferase [Ferruginibacter sp.]